MTSRSGAVDKSSKALVADLQREGVKVAALDCDITNRKALEEAVSSCLSDMPPVRGCIQASMVLNVSLPFALFFLSETWRFLDIALLTYLQISRIISSVT
jgi:Mrp family chromosome partitioning ATPase